MTAQAAPARGVDEAAGAAEPVLQMRGARLSFGDRTLWHDLELDVRPGEFVAVLGANGSGKTSLLRVLLGDLQLTAGSAHILGQPVRRGSDRVGYVPQRVSVDAVTMIKARDLVRMGLDGHRWGPPIRHRRQVRERIDALLESVGATAFAESPVSMLSGGELQRIRIAEAVASDPAVLLCDEPLAALDYAHQQAVVALLDAHRRASGSAVLFVTHDVNTVLGSVDKVLYLAGGRFRLGTPDEVLTSAGLTELYGAPVDVFHAHGRVIVVAAADPGAGVHHVVDDHGVAHARPHPLPGAGGDSGGSRP
jgi:zinc/manganese transport system ATP-binding protein